MPERRRPTPFGRAVKLRLCELGLEQKDLARMLGVSSAYVTYLIYGDRRNDAWVGRICQALDMKAPPPQKRVPICPRRNKTDSRRAAPERRTMGWRAASICDIMQEEPACEEDSAK